jgi:hypothetical protein
MKYAVVIASGGMTYIPSFVKIGSGVEHLLRWIHIQEGDFISLL